jgi:hypothetical protein
MAIQVGPARGKPTTSRFRSVVLAKDIPHKEQARQEPHLVTDDDTEVGGCATIRAVDPQLRSGKRERRDRFKRGIHTRGTRALIAGSRERGQE